MMIRITEVFRGDEWIQVRFEELQKGEIFRLFNPPDYTPVKWNSEDSAPTKFIAMSNPFLNNEAVWEIECDPVEELILCKSKHT